MELELRSELTDEAAILYCAGDLVAGHQTALLRANIHELLKQRRKIVVDLAQVNYIDSTGLSVLVGLYSAVRTTNGEIHYQNLSASVNFRRSRGDGSLAA